MWSLMHVVLSIMIVPLRVIVVVTVTSCYIKLQVQMYSFYFYKKKGHLVAVCQAKKSKPKFNKFEKVQYNLGQSYGSEHQCTSVDNEPTTSTSSKLNNDGSVT